MNLEFLYHTGSRYVFTRMQNIIWTASGLALAHMIEKKAGDLLAKIVNEHQKEKPLVVNFKGIVSIDDHALDNFFSALKDNSRQIIILEGNSLTEQLFKLRKQSPTKINDDPENGWISVGKENSIDIDSVKQELDLLKKDFVKQTIQNCFIKSTNQKRLSSTPIVTNGEYDSNLIISNIKQFIWISTFLSDEICRILDESKIPNPKLLTASLRGAPFVSTVGMINNLPYETIDHFGPKHKVFDLDFLTRIEKGYNYIYVGDFCFGGTEIKLAKTYTEIKGSNLNHALVIASLIEPSYFKEQFNLFTLSNLSNFPELKYSI